MTVGSQADQGKAPVARDRLHVNCAGSEVFGHVTSRWGILVLAALLDGPLRFAALRDEVEGISEKMLSQNLRDLVGDGLIARSVEPDTPPKVSYALTPPGRELAERLYAVLEWIGRNLT
ncbi:helix-turn-helix transcriptional regulator [Crossiella sp. SN42]|uniref:winged helix-turn-helix transcriptional regulator n=1 Tax=Crossiella sp. SN42 TaxID=2944808 RepID=UPI00207D4921|nr:helix-turn-helix domain-containing protein [Crossiella sp. SN42]MCO1575680.1 helix-turn-helix transcriptional regulator [Crossiella sp. SN42]